MKLGLSLLVRRSLRQHAASTVITAVAIALGTGLVMAVLGIKTQTHHAFVPQSGIGFDAVLGGRGSQLQLVLNTIFHLETSPGNIPWRMYQEIKADPRIALAIPYAVGDNYRGFRIVGTTEEIFTRFDYQRGRKFQVEPGGRFFDPQRREAVVGSYVAQRTGLRIGSRFHAAHGLTETADGDDDHEEEYLVVGVLQPTNSPSDRVIWIPIEGVFRMGGHVLRGAGEEYVAAAGEEIPDEHKEVSAVMLKFKTPQAGFALDQSINKQGKEATLAWPLGSVMLSLFDKIGWVDRVLTLVAWLVVFVATASILAGIYNSINERRREFAILRSLGARRRTVFVVVVLEAATMALLGAALGYVVHAAIFTAAAAVIRSQTGVVLELLQFHPALLLTPPAVTVLGALAGLLPAWKAYRTDVAANLAPIS